MPSQVIHAGSASGALRCAHGPAVVGSATGGMRPEATGATACGQATLAGRHERDRQERIAGGAAGLLPLERVAHGLGGGRALHVEQHRLGQEARLLGVGVEPRLHQVAGHVAEQQQAGEQEEGDDQQARDEADEDVGQDQLAAHAPQQPAAHPDRAARRQVAEARARARACRPRRRVASQPGSGSTASRRRPSTSLIARPTSSALPGSVPISQRRARPRPGPARGVAHQQRRRPGQRKARADRPLTRRRPDRGCGGHGRGPAQVAPAGACERASRADCRPGMISE